MNNNNIAAKNIPIATLSAYLPINNFNAAIERDSRILPHCHKV